MQLLGSWSVLTQVASPPVCSGPSPFCLTELFRLTGPLILYLKSTYQKWGVGAEARKFQALFGHLIVTLTTETRSHLGDHSVMV